MSFTVYRIGREKKPERAVEDPDRDEHVEVEESPAKGGRQPSDAMSRLAAQTLKDPNATDREKKLAASLLSQDETRGLRTPRRK